MSNNTLRLGIVGPGTAFKNLHFPEIRKFENIEIVEIMSHSIESARLGCDWVQNEIGHEPRASSVTETSGDYDAVLITVPINQNYNLSEMFLSSGKHVFCEKPVSETVKECQTLLSLAKNKNLAFLAGENFRLQPDFKKVRNYIQSGIIGDEKLYFLNDLHFTSSDGVYAKTSWRVKGEHKGGYLYDGGTHIIAGLREMVGRRVESVHALAVATQDYLSGKDDAMLINIEFEGGYIGHVALGYGVHDNESRHPKIYGTKGTIKLTKSALTLITADGESELEKRSGLSGFFEEWMLFEDAVKSKDYNEVYYLTKESISDLQVLESAIKSVKSGSSVKL